MLQIYFCYISYTVYNVLVQWEGIAFTNQTIFICQNGKTVPHEDTHANAFPFECVCVYAYVNVLFEMDFSRQNKSQKKTTQEELDNQFSVRHPISHSPLLTFATMTNHTTNHLHQKRTSSGQLS